MDSVKIYLINVVAVATDESRFDRLNYWMKHSLIVEGYWNYIPCVYAIKSRLSSHEIRSNLIPVLAGSFMVSEVNIRNIDGLLPKDAWTWFYDPPTPRAQGLAGVALPAPQSLLSLGKRPPP